jgi:hypothetical protein
MTATFRDRLQLLETKPQLRSPTTLVRETLLEVSPSCGTLSDGHHLQAACSVVNDLGQVRIADLPDTVE